MEMLVNPGMVLISFRKMRGFLILRALSVACRFHQEVDAGKAGAVAGAEGGQRHLADLLRFGGGEFGGNDGDGGVFGRVGVLRVVVVELLVGDDLADHRGLGLVVAQDCDLELARLDAGAADALLDDELAVEAGGEVEGRGQLAAIVDLADADRGAEVGGLDEERIAQRLFDEPGDAFWVGTPLAAQQGDVRCLGQAGGGEETLHGVLVHGGGGAENTGADVGDVGQLEETLDGSVLAEGAVQDGEDDVERGGERVAGLREFGAGAAFAGGPWRGAADAGAVAGCGAARRYAGRRRRWRTRCRFGCGFTERGEQCEGELLPSRRWASSPLSQRPCLSMAMGTTSYRLRSMALRMEAAESSETSCSPERPPKRMPMRSFFFMGIAKV